MTQQTPFMDLPPGTPFTSTGLLKFSATAQHHLAATCRWYGAFRRPLHTSAYFTLSLKKSRRASCSATICDRRVRKQQQGRPRRRFKTPVHREDKPALDMDYATALNVSVRRGKKSPKYIRSTCGHQAQAKHPQALTKENAIAAPLPSPGNPTPPAHAAASEPLSSDKRPGNTADAQLR